MFAGGAVGAGVGAWVGCSVGVAVGFGVAVLPLLPDEELPLEVLPDEESPFEPVFLVAVGLGVTVAVGVGVTVGAVVSIDVAVGVSVTVVAAGCMVSEDVGSNEVEELGLAIGVVVPACTVFDCAFAIKIMAMTITDAIIIKIIMFFFFNCFTPFMSCYS